MSVIQHVGSLNSGVLSDPELSAMSCENLGSRDKHTPSGSQALARTWDETPSSRSSPTGTRTTIGKWASNGISTVGGHWSKDCRVLSTAEKLGLGNDSLQ